MTPLILASAIFVLAYLFIATEWIPKWVTAIAAGMLVIVLRLVNQEEAFHAIDFNVIFLLAGMMMIANILGKTAPSSGWPSRPPSWRGATPSSPWLCWPWQPPSSLPSLTM